MDIKPFPVCRRHLVHLAGLLMLIAIVFGVKSVNGGRISAPVGAPVLEQFFDLDRNNIPEHYVLERARLAIYENDKLLWESPADWRINSFILADANNDGRDDLLLVLWKNGSFGRDKPFWLNKPDIEWSNHLFVYDLVGGHLKPVWMSSALVPPINTLKVQDINHDGRNELLMLESRPLLPLSPVSAGNPPVVMQWRGWGFYQVDTNDRVSKTGSFPRNNLTASNRVGAKYCIVLPVSKVIGRQGMWVGL